MSVVLGPMGLAVRDLNARAGDIAMIAAGKSGPERVAELTAVLAPYSSDQRVVIERTAIESFLDPQYYLVRNPGVRIAGIDPVEHFRVRGWHELRRPCAEFDVGWYWSTMLDPDSDAINPLVHYAAAGMEEGLPTHAPFTQPRETAPLPSGARRAVLFAGYDADGLIDDSVVAYVTELSRFADVFYLADSEMRAGQLDRLHGITAGAWAVRHGAYDFGSYCLLAGHFVGWDRLEEYDEVVLVNDSCYLVRPLDGVFAEMAGRSCDWWGLQATEEVASPAYGETVDVETTWHARPMRVLAEPIQRERVPLVVRDMFSRFPEQEFHVGSYFIGLRRAVLQDGTFRRFLSAVRPGLRRMAVVERYEWGLTRLLISLGYSFETYIEELYPCHPMYSGQWAFALMERGFPLVKRAMLATNPFGFDLTHWQASLTDVAPQADVAVIGAHLERTVDQGELQRALTRLADADRRLSHR